jgi:hypothetical protein
MPDPRACDYCGTAYQPKTAKSRYCHPNHRVAAYKAAKAGRPMPARLGPPMGGPPAADPRQPPSTQVADAITRELEQLALADTYEGTVAIGLAKQLDSGVIVGSAYVSLSKELDRRVDALRLRAPRPDDPAQVARAQVEEKLRLVQGGAG